MKSRRPPAGAKILGVAGFGSCTLRRGAAHVDGFGAWRAAIEKGQPERRKSASVFATKKVRSGNTGTMDQLKARRSTKLRRQILRPG
jgi:hypothetical protein